MDLIAKALGGGGIVATVAAFLVAIAGGGYWLTQLAARRYKRVVNFSVAFLTFVYYGGQIVAITAFSVPTSDPPYDQKLGLFTLMIFGLFFAMASGHALKRPVDRSGKVMEGLLWMYSSFITVSQVWNHSIGSAILLSIGAGWQYLMLFYVLISVIETEKDVLRFLNSLFVFSVVNTFFLVMTKGEPIIRSLSESASQESLREGTVGALGPPVSAAVYLAVLITLALGAFHYTRKKRYLLYIAFVFVELLNTLTRGGIFILFLLAVLLLFDVGRPLVRRMWPLFILAIPFVNVIWKYISFRGFNIDVTKEGNFVGRLAITAIYFRDFYHFSLVGNGISQNTVVDYFGWLAPLHNAYLEILDVCGAIVFLIFIAITIHSLRSLILIYNRRGKARPLSSGRSYISLAPFFFVALLQWVVYANTTSTSVLSYYPYEGTAVFWLICFSPHFLSRIGARQDAELLQESGVSSIPSRKW